MENTRRILRRLALVMPLLVFSLLLYTFLHEGGHALAGVVFGGTLTSFNINFFDLSAHAGVRGEFTHAQQALISLAGVSLPLITWALLMLLLPRRSNTIISWFKILYSVGVINSLLAYIIIPILFLFGSAPADDSVNFLRFSGLPPQLVSVAALLVYAGGWAFFLRLMGGWRSLISFFRADYKLDFSQPSVRGTALVFLALAAAILAASVGLSSAGRSAGAFEIPAGYVLVREIDLSERAFTEETVYAFSLEKREEFRLFITLENIDHGPLAIELRGTGGYKELFFSMGAESRIGYSSVHPRGELEAGDYQLVLSAAQNRAAIINLFVSRLP